MFIAAILRNKEDLNAFNQIQILNCSTNIYFSKWGDLEDLRKQVDLCIAAKLTSRHRINAAVLDSVEETGKRYRLVNKADLDGHSEILLHVEYLSSTPPRWPTIIH